MVKKLLIVVISIHHDNTVKIAKAMAKVFKTEIRKPNDVKPDEIKENDLFGFGSGIYGAKHHESLIKLSEKLPIVSGNKAFLFSTAGITSKKKSVEDHSKLSNILESKGYEIVGNFQCKGFNTNSFLKYFGGMNKGRPNADDIQNAEDFVKNLI